ncbi:MAG TPA: TIGR03086 family metal-binding protein [Nocardioidaceae bacterium]|nr:TIGR03086 family metal-binding protein [Nocardioidaceae bacterium]
MTLDRTAAPLVAGVALLERSLGYTLGSLLLVASDDLQRPTPCRQWDLAMLLAHMDDSLRALHEATVGGHVGLEPAPCWHDDVHPAVPAVATLRNRACRLLGAWNQREAHDHLVSVAGRSMTAPLVAATGAVEVAVHGWDVAQACGRPRPLPSPLADELLDLAPLLVSYADRGARFASPVAVAPNTAAGDRLLAYLGRTPP